MCCCCVTRLLGRHEHVRLTGDREPMADRSKNTTKIQLQGPMSFLGVTHKSRNGQKAAVSRSPRAWMTAHAAWTCRAHYRAWRKPHTLKSVTFQAAQVYLLYSAFPQSLLLICTWGWRGSVSLISFRNFLKLLSCLVPDFDQLFCRVECFASS